MAKPRANLRLFVAIHPPARVAAAMVDAVQRMRDLPPHRLTPAEQVHLTLQFIGVTPAAELDETIESVQRSGSGLGSFSLQPLRLITLPERGSTRLIACETDAPPLLRELQRRLSHRLATNPRSEKDQRFRPHLTLCRLRSPAAQTKYDQDIEITSFPVTEIRLMRSTLDPTGAQHHEVARVPLELAFSQRHKDARTQ